jgi:hypothetical protein
MSPPEENYEQNVRAVIATPDDAIDALSGVRDFLAKQGYEKAAVIVARAREVLAWAAPESAPNPAVMDVSAAEDRLGRLLASALNPSRAPAAAARPVAFRDAHLGIHRRLEG